MQLAKYFDTKKTIITIAQQSLLLVYTVTARFFSPVTRDSVCASSTKQGKTSELKMWATRWPDATSKLNSWRATRRRRQTTTSFLKTLSISALSSSDKRMSQALLEHSFLWPDFHALLWHSLQQYQACLQPLQRRKRVADFCTFKAMVVMFTEEAMTQFFFNLTPLLHSVKWASQSRRHKLFPHVRLQQVLSDLPWNWIVRAQHTRKSSIAPSRCSWSFVNRYSSTKVAPRVCNNWTRTFPFSAGSSTASFIDTLSRHGAHKTLPEPSRCCYRQKQTLLKFSDFFPDINKGRD